MRPNYDDAVLRRADMASLQVWIQTALRIVLAITLLWALITTALVWYWMGHYGGPPAHEYFGRGFWRGSSLKSFRCHSVQFHTGASATRSTACTGTSAGSITSAGRLQAGSGTTRRGGLC